MYTTFMQQKPGPILDNSQDHQKLTEQEHGVLKFHRKISSGL